MDKMIQTGKGETIITNDGNTMLKDMSVMHPAAKMLVDLSAAQDVEAGDGTTSVVVIAGSLLGAADRLLGKGWLPQAFLWLDIMLILRQEYIRLLSPNLSSERPPQQYRLSMTCHIPFNSQIELPFFKLLLHPFPLKLSLSTLAS